VIECIFTLDYEIYGNGEGSLQQLVYEPAARLRELFLQHGARFVPFVEVAELEMIEAHGTDPAIGLVTEQLRTLHAEGFSPGLHLHPQWYNGRYEDRRWILDSREYNLCTLPKERIAHILDRSLAYFRRVLQAPGFTPLAFRAGNWLFKPTRVAAQVLAERGVRLDSSVFKGGVRHEHNLDYRRALTNGYYWRFQDHADVADASGDLLEVPIHTEMIPFWRIATTKRISMERQNVGRAAFGRKGWFRLLDLFRVHHPVKFDFCRMTLDELTSMLTSVIADDRRSPASLKPLVAIGHTKELVDFETISALLSWLSDARIKVSTFEEIYPRCV
jgi:hypothetical protein